jgi:hypothetical protein
MKRFKHSGAFGDLLYSLPIVRHFGGGEFYLHLNQMDWIGQHYYGSQPDPFHQGRMTDQDFDYMKRFMEAQSYITRFDKMSRSTEITHNLDRFRPPFVGHPDNYINIYAQVFGLTPDQTTQARVTPWLTVPTPTPVAGRPWVINRSSRWIPTTPGPQWAQWKTEGREGTSVFVGLESEYVVFKQQTGWDIPWYPTKDQLDLAEIIAGAEVFIGNQSQALALAIGLGVPRVWCEARVDMPLLRNECYFADISRIRYF